MRQPFRSLLVLASVLAPACAPSAPSAAGAAPAPLRMVAAGDQVLWWVHATELGSALAWFGPAHVDSQGLEGRQWVMTCTLPGAAQPVTYFQSSVELDSVEAIGIHAGDYDVVLRPAAGLTWGQVAVTEDIDAQVEGFEM